MDDHFFALAAAAAPVGATLSHPSFVGVAGANNGNALATAEDAGTFALLFETSANGVPLPLLSGWTNVLTNNGDAHPNSVDCSSRVSYKFLAAGEAIPANTGSRRVVMFFSSVNPTTPIHAAAGALDRSTEIIVPALTLTEPRIVAAFTRRDGTSTPPLISPLTTRIVQGSSAITQGGSTADLQLSWPGLSLPTAGEDWNAASIALNPVVIG